ncbi:hypothetical protein S83_068919 [Arachis hypogaea]
MLFIHWIASICAYEKVTNSEQSGEWVNGPAFGCGCEIATMPFNVNNATYLSTVNVYMHGLGSQKWWPVSTQ